ncbi:MAG: restriction endonuclease subunit S [Saprospiraceae bacterium]
MRWEKTKLDEIKNDEKYSLIGGPFGSKLTSKDYVSVEGVPVIRGINLPFEKKFSHDDLVFVSEEKAVELRSNLAYPNDIIFTQRGTLGQVGLIPIGYYEKYVVSQSQMKLTVNPEKAIPEFVYYFFSSEEGRRSIEAKSITSGVPHINLGILKSTEIPLPPLPTQHRIASILSAYDDLIENNLKRIKLLEEAAQNIYREWFVHFRYPGHERVRRGADGLPEGWRRGKLSDIAYLKKKTVKPTEFESFTRYVGLEHIPRQSITLKDWGTTDDINSDKLFFEKLDILFGKIRPYFHKVVVAPFNGVTSTDTYVVQSKTQEAYSFLMMVLSSTHFVEYSYVTCKEGSKMPRADWGMMEKYPITVAPQKLLKEFNDIVAALLRHTFQLVEMNVFLKEARDILLPRLMNRTIEV